MAPIRTSFVAASACAALAGPAFAAQQTPELPRCAEPIGTVAIQEPQRDWWSPLGLSNPEALIKLMAGRSNCLRVVARGQAMQMRQGERELGDSGELQPGQNFGKGQVVAADYFIIPDIVGSNADAGGASFGGIGRAFGGPFGSIVGGLSVRSSTAHTLITLVNARTTEQEYVAEGTAKKTDIGFSGGGGGGWDWGVVGGGYSNTDIGRVITIAYINAFADLINHMQGAAPGAAAAAAPIQAYTVTAPLVMRSGPSPAAGRVRDFASGDLVYPTGQKNGVWWEVDDENGNRGWVSSAHISPRGH